MFTFSQRFLLLSCRCTRQNYQATAGLPLNLTPPSLYSLVSKFYPLYENSIRSQQFGVEIRGQFPRNLLSFFRDLDEEQRLLSQIDSRLMNSSNIKRTSAWMSHAGIQASSGSIDTAATLRLSGYLTTGVICLKILLQLRKGRLGSTQIARLERLTKSLEICGQRVLPTSWVTG